MENLDTQAPGQSGMENPETLAKLGNNTQHEDIQNKKKNTTQETTNMSNTCPTRKPG
jgi:hypothetical protein